MRRLVLRVGASVVLAVFAGVLLHAQERKEDKKAEAKPSAPAAVPGPAQERVEIRGIIDSWYRILQGEMHVGYRHEVLQPSAPAPVRYDYMVLEEVETEVQDPQDPQRKIPTMRSLHIRGRLDDAYAPIDMEVRIQKDNVETLGTVVPGETGRRLSVRLPDATQKTFDIRTADVDLYYSTQLMFVSMRQNEMLSRTGLHTPKVFHIRADEVPVVEVQFDVKEWVQREYLGKKVPVTRIEWIKPLPAPSRDLEVLESFVDKYGRVVEEVTRGGTTGGSPPLRMVLAKGQEEAEGQTTHIRPAGRQDPFRKDLAMPTKVVKTGVVPGTEIGSVTGPKTVDEGLKQADKLLDELKKAVERNDKPKAREFYDQIIQLYVHLREVAAKDTNQENRGRVEIIKKRVEEAFPGALILLQKAREIYAEAMKAFEREDVGGMQKLVDELVKVEKAPELVGSDQLTAIRQLRTELEPLLGRCKTRLELAKKKLSLTGVVLHFDEKPQTLEASLLVFGHTVGASHEVRFIRATHFAIINDKMYKVGDVVDGEGVRIEKIWKYGVQVSLKEETREVPIRQ